MKSIKLSLVLFFIFTVVNIYGQKKPTTIDLHDLVQKQRLKAINGKAEALSDGIRKGVHFSETENDDLAWLDGVTFGNGTIELDIRGREILQKSFIGIAFHGLNDETMDVVYFRPFNFQSTDSVRRIHAVQYVSSPDFGWKRLRDERNGQYEKGIIPAPSGKDWFHAKIVVHYPHISVYVNGNPKASLTVDKLNVRQTGKLGLWVGPQSGGDFANLSIKPE